MCRSPLRWPLLNYVALSPLINATDSEGMVVAVSAEDFAGSGSIVPRNAGNSTPATERNTSIMGGILFAIFQMNAAVPPSQLPLPPPFAPPSHTTILSNLMFEMAFAAALNVRALSSCRLSLVES